MLFRSDLFDDRELETNYVVASSLGIPALNTTGTSNLFFTVDGMPTNASADAYFLISAEVQRPPAYPTAADLARVCLRAQWPLKPFAPYGVPATNGNQRTFIAQFARKQ